jgi:hypothetical protein
MCRNIRPLFNFEPATTPDEVRLGGSAAYPAARVPRLESAVGDAPAPESRDLGAGQGSGGRGAEAAGTVRSALAAGMTITRRSG